MMFKSKWFSVWFVLAFLVWIALFSTFDSFAFLKDHWYYPAVMVFAAFVAGLTPQSGGAIAFPALSVFLHIDRVLARDFSMMIQSIGLTSASIFILTHKDTVLRNYRPVLMFLPVCAAGFVLGMNTLQSMPVYLIQAFFLSLITTFVAAYYLHRQRGTKASLAVATVGEGVWLGLILFLGGMVTSLFGTGTDILLYTILITRFSMNEKAATRLAIVTMTGMSILGFAYRAFVDHGLSHYQFDTWLCAYPVVLFMAPLGAFVLRKVHVNWLLLAIVILDVFQLLYFNFSRPSQNKTLASAVFCALFSVVFYLLLRRIRVKRAEALEPTSRQRCRSELLPPGCRIGGNNRANSRNGAAIVARKLDSKCIGSRNEGR